MKTDNWWSRGSKPHKERAADIPDTIRDWELNTGGWRYDETNTGYKLTWEQLLTYERKNLEVESDTEFYDWFKTFRKDKGITSRSYSGTLSDKSSWGGWDDTWVEKPKSKWLSGWWAKDTYRAISGSDAETRLALVLQAVRSTIRVVDDTTPPLVVDWSQNGGSYTDFGKNHIAINPDPVREGKMEDGQAIDITTGFALHEASHSKYSRQPYETIIKPKPLRPMQVAGMLLNFVEDIRIEAATAEEFPGFAGYFDASLKWAWEKSQKNMPKKWGPELWEKMNAILAIIRFPDGPKVLTDKSFAPEIPWWTNWRDEYLSGKVDARTTIQRGLDRLAEDPDTKKEMDGIAQNEEELEKLGESLKSILEKALKEGLKKMKMKPCITEDEGRGLTPDEAEVVKRLVNEKLEKDQPHIKVPDGRGNHPLYITHPLESPQSKRAYIGKPKPMLGRLKAALVFRQELPRHVNRLLKRGGLDEEELWRWADGDYRVFNEEVIAEKPQTQMSLLVDLSGSMYGEKLKIAQELAQLFIWALKDIDGVTTKVFGHSGDNNGSTGSVDIYRLWEPGEPMTRLGLITTLDHGNNYDGHAIAWCAKEILQRGQPDEQRIIIVLSDGYPAGIGYGGSTGQAHVRQVTDWADKQGIGVIQIAIDHGMDPSRQARMFKRFIEFTSFDELPKKLTNLLAKLT